MNEGSANIFCLSSNLFLWKSLSLSLSFSLNNLISEQTHVYGSLFVIDHPKTPVGPYINSSSCDLANYWFLNPLEEKKHILGVG